MGYFFLFGTSYLRRIGNMAKIIRTFTKADIKDPWVTADTTEYFSQEEIDTIIKPWFNIFTSMPGFISSTNYFTGVSMICLSEFSTLEEAKKGADFLYDKSSELSKKRLALFSREFNKYYIKRYNLTCEILES